jgi:hypothetical protein
MCSARKEVTMKGRSAVLAFAFVVVASGQSFADTILYYTSTPGSWVGGGETATVTPATNFGFDFVAQQNFDNGVSFFIDDFAHNPDFQSTRWWFLDLAAPNSMTLAPGLYLGATRFPFQEPDEPGLSFGGNGRANNMQTGYFRVFEVQVDSSDVVMNFAADFLQFDETQTVDYTWGSIRFNSSVPITETPVLQPVPEPSAAALVGLGIVLILTRRRVAARVQWFATTG